jgi:hypothetical protein
MVWECVLTSRGHIGRLPVSFFPISAAEVKEARSPDANDICPEVSVGYRLRFYIFLKDAVARNPPPKQMGSALLIQRDALPLEFR